jgi:hypothetical protein
MVTKGKPTARSQSYKALKLQEKIISTPTPGNDVLPSPISKLVIQDEGARRTFNTVLILAQRQAQLQKIQAKYDQIAAQVSEEDTLLIELYDHFDGDYPTHRLDIVAAELRELRPYLGSRDPRVDAW